MADPTVLVERRDDGVVLLTLNRPPLNPLSSVVFRELGERVAELTADPGLKAVVVTGNERAFAAGADITEFEDRAAINATIEPSRGALDALAAIPRPVIAAINGYALGGGLELALACDLRVAGEQAKLGLPEILLGIIPGVGGTQRLTRLVGPARAKDMIWTGRHLRADEALAVGLVDRVVPPEETLDAALAWAAELGAGAVAAMAITKRAVDAGLDLPLEMGLDLERAGFLEVFGTEDAEIGVASFLEHGPGKAQFVGR